jgi:hypothetical protein
MYAYRQHNILSYMQHTLKCHLQYWVLVVCAMDVFLGNDHVAASVRQSVHPRAKKLMCVDVYVCMHACMCTHAYMSPRLSVSSCEGTPMLVDVYVCMYTCIYVYSCTYTSAFVN